MRKQVVILFLTGFVVGTLSVNAAAIQGLAVHNEGLTYLGLYKNPTTTATALEKRETANAVFQQTSYYFLSQNSAGHYTSDRDCKDFLGEDATLIYIETKEELKAVTKFIANSDDSGASYWVGCKYDTTRRTFVWGNGAELGPWAPWDAGHPETRTAVTRVSVHTQGSRSQAGLKLRTQLQTVSNRYICELKVGNPEEEALPCYKNNDLAIVVDSSDVVTKGSYVIFLEFITRVAIAWADNPGNRLAVIVTSETGQSVFGFNDSLSIGEFRDNFFKAPQLGGASGISEGIAKALEEFQKNEKSGSVKNVIVLSGGRIGPGAENDGDKLKTAGINTFVVGAGGDATKGEMLFLTQNKDDRVWAVDGFENILRVLQALSKKICSVDQMVVQAPKGEVKEYVAK